MLLFVSDVVINREGWDDIIVYNLVAEFSQYIDDIKNVICSNIFDDNFSIQLLRFHGSLESILYKLIEPAVLEEIKSKYNNIVQACQIEASDINMQVLSRILFICVYITEMYHTNLYNIYVICDGVQVCLRDFLNHMFDNDFKDLEKQIRSYLKEMQKFEGRIQKSKKEIYSSDFSNDPLFKNLNSAMGKLLFSIINANK